MGATSPPWRMLESPAEAEDDDGPAQPEATAPGVRFEAATLRILGVVVAAVVLAGGAFAMAVASGSGDGVRVDAVDGAALPSASGGADVTGAPLVVEVSGAVAHPGVYRVPGGARVADAIEAAGGYGPRIDTARSTQELDLVAALTDGARIHVPSRDDPPASAVAPVAGGGGAGAEPGRIDLNTATIEALDTLPGIGPVTAEKIVAAREEAPFTSVEDLRTRGVLGEKTFERLRDLVTVP